MIILTNCLTETEDEGALKVANSLIKRIKAQYAGARVFSYERTTQLSDRHMSLNKLMLNPGLLYHLWRSGEEVIYIPFPTGMLPACARMFILSLFVRKRLKVVLSMQGQINRIAACLLRMSRAQTFSLSKESWQACERVIGEKAVYLKTGVDTEKYVHAAQEKKTELRRKYGIPEDRVVVLHVGHMNEGRNLQQFLKLDEKYFSLIVTSTFTRNEQDARLRKRLEDRGNGKIIDTYLPNIEEIYQLSDVYFFPVACTGHCIDAPLSAFEAASCNLPVVHTAYGELSALCGRDGFYQIRSFEPEALNGLIDAAVSEKKEPRNSILTYDWNRAIDSLCQ
ncbi:MAG: glycosyltransferase [Clostridia bacterium]|nr:glycosyltransferase [Clostridia bacterium]